MGSLEHYNARVLHRGLQSCAPGGGLLRELALTVTENFAAFWLQQETWETEA